MHIICGAHAFHQSLAVVVQGGPGGVGDEGLRRIVPQQLAAAMAVQMHHRRPAAGHGDGIAGDFLQHRALACHQAERDGFHIARALDLDHGATGFHADAHGAGAGGQITVRLRSCVDDHRYRQPRLAQRDGGQVGAVVGGDDDGAIPRRDAEVHHIVAHRPGQHHAGDVVSGEGDRAFDGPGGGDYFSRANAPEAFAGAV